MIDEEFDYSKSGLDIQYAILDKRKKVGNGVPLSIRWGEHTVKTVDHFRVPKSGGFRAQFLSVSNAARQGFDIKVSGSIAIGEQRVPLLRTWYDESLPNWVEYKYESIDGILRIYNVYEMIYFGGKTVEEKWTGNAGFWVEVKSDKERIYHCSPGGLPTPDYEAMVLKIEII